MGQREREKMRKRGKHREGEIQREITHQEKLSETKRHRMRERERNKHER